ncbi:MAG: hypothetical protein J7521_17910 [Caulobacter sp.]|nr:hypothetical protein [Caulobacter sp.]
MRSSAILAFVFVLSAASTAHADMACLIEGQVYGETVKDCSQTSLPVPAAEYGAQCKDNGAGPLKATVLKACPAKAQAACVNPFGQKVTTFYYSRSPQSLADTKASCAAQKGKWVANP